jgi:hypothetical protein
MKNRYLERGPGVKALTSNKGGQGPSHAPRGEELAVSALAFLAGEPDRLSRFLDICGLGPHNLRAAAADPAFLAAVLDYLLSDEPLLIGFAGAEGVSPERVAAARRAMDGPA